MQQRRSPRLKGYDYSQPGAYFVTICIQDRSKMFGDVANNVMCLSPAGEITQAVWDSLAERFPHVSLDVYVVMPNHFHGIVVISDAKLNNTTRHQPALGEIIRTFKALTTRYIRVTGTSEFGWQQKYWDTIIRNEYQLDEGISKLSQVRKCLSGYAHPKAKMWF